MWRKLRNWFAPTDVVFDAFGGDVLDSGSKVLRRIFRRGADGRVLAVAHVDTVKPPCWWGREGAYIYASGLDDRLGCWLAWWAHIHYGCDLLLCDNEEKGQSTAASHWSRDYNWVVEFDRRGDDWVTYGRSSAEFEACVGEWFGSPGKGSYSDIVVLRTRACCVNLGIGYEDPHGWGSRVHVPTLEEQRAAFDGFFDEYAGQRFQVNGPHRYREKIRAAIANDAEITARKARGVSNTYTGASNYCGAHVYRKCEGCDDWKKCTQVGQYLLCASCEIEYRATVPGLV